MNYVVDAHTHTIASGHAYNTIAEMAAAAKQAGLQALGITEHGPAIPGSCNEIYFSNYKVIDRFSLGIELLMGVEMNILDYDGTLDVKPGFLRWIDVGIAGIHRNVCYTPGSAAENTRAYLKAMESPHVDIISHPDDGRVPVDYEALVRGAKEMGVLLELNNSSLDPLNVRSQGNCAENMKAMLSWCERLAMPVVVNSDAHYATQVGGVSRIQAIVEEVRFPEELVVNTSLDKLKSWLHRFRAQEV